MTGSFDSYPGALAASLSTLGASLDSRGPAGWDFTLPGASVSGRASIGAGWLVLSAPCAGDALSLSHWELLLRQGALVPPWRFIVAPSSGIPAVAGELRLRSFGVVAERVAGLCGGAAAALALATGESVVAGGNASSTGAEHDAAGDPADLAELLRAGGWSFREGAGETLVVDLASPRGFFQASLVRARTRGVRLSAMVARGNDLAVESREAIAMLLLSVAGAVRQVYAAIIHDDAGPAVELGVVCMGAAVAGDLDDALSALTTAVDLCGPEVLALQDAALARRYLAARGRSSCPQTTPQPAPVS